MHTGHTQIKSRKAASRTVILKSGKYPCAFCKGRGVMPGQKSLACSVCRGAGAVKVVRWAAVCAYCRGQGTSVVNRSLPCLACGGKGIVGILRRTARRCPDCRGTGRAQNCVLPCWSCRGSGVDIRLVDKKGVILWKKTTGKKRKSRTKN